MTPGNPTEQQTEQTVVQLPFLVLCMAHRHGCTSTLLFIRYKNTACMVIRTCNSYAPRGSLCIKSVSCSCVCLGNKCSLRLEMQCSSAHQLKSKTDLEKGLSPPCHCTALNPPKSMWNRNCNQSECNPTVLFIAFFCVMSPFVIMNQPEIYWFLTQSGLFKLWLAH